ncbi:MAG: RMD1 family protein [Pirellulales bacterium]
MGAKIDHGIEARIKPRELAGVQDRAFDFLPSSNRSAATEIAKPQFTARALYVGEHIDVRWLLKSTRVTAQQPALIPLEGGGIAVLYRYGAVVFFDTAAPHEKRFLADLTPLVSHSYAQPETEEIVIRVSPQDREGVEHGTVIVMDGTSQRLEIVAAALGKSVALAQYEADVAMNFELIEPFATQLERSGSGGHNIRQLLRHIGRALLNEHKMVARVEVVDRPELLWERPELEQLYLRLEDEFELRERAAILDRKLDLISRTAGTVLDLLQKRRSSRVEWYIVILIILEIAISVYSLLGHGL